LNKSHLTPRSDDPLLAARIKSFETAFGMQMAVPDAFDLKQESDATLKLYGSSAPARPASAGNALSHGASSSAASVSSN